MSYQVICVSSVDGAAADDVAPRIAERLGYRLVDEEIVARAARDAEIDPGSIADVERRPSLVNRVLDHLASTAGASGAIAGYVHDPGLDLLDADALRGLIRSAIEQVADQGRVVIVAHAASFALTARADTLRVFLTASPDVRAGRLGVAGDGAKELARLDANRADYLKRFYGIASERPHHYDLVLNTDRVSARDAAEIVATTASS